MGRRVGMERMTTAAAAQRIMLGTISDPHRAGIVRELLDAVVVASNEIVEVRLAARIRVAASRFRALRQATTEDEFEATFDLVARPRLFLEVLSIVQDPVLKRLADQLSARELSPRTLMNPLAQEYADDLLERANLVFQRCLVVHRAGAEDNARAFTAFMALMLAAIDRHAWHPWMVGMLWNLGRRAVLGMATRSGLTWEQATDLLVTKRDRAISARPFDPAGSDETSRILGLQ